MYDTSTGVSNRLLIQCQPILNHKTNISVLEISGWLTPNGCYTTNLTGEDKCHPHWGSLAFHRSLYPAHRFTDSYNNEDLSFVHSVLSAQASSLLVIPNQYFVATRHATNSWKFRPEHYSQLIPVPCEAIVRDPLDVAIYQHKSSEENVVIAADQEVSAYMYSETEIQVRKNIDWGIDYRPQRNQGCIWTRKDRTTINTTRSIQWKERIRTAPFTPRHNFLLFGTLKKVVVLCGGYSKNGIEKDCWLTRDKGASWEMYGTSAPWGKTIGMTSLTTQKHGVLVLGGCTSTIFYNRGLDLFFLSSLLWKDTDTEPPPTIDSSRSNSSSSRFSSTKRLFPIVVESPLKEDGQNMMVQLGGYSCDSIKPSGIVSRISLVNLSIESVHKVDLFDQMQINIVAATTFASAIVAIGITSGSTLSEEKLKNVVFNSFDGGRSWVVVINESNDFNGVTHFGLFASSSLVYVVGGSQEGTAMKVIRTSADSGKTWKTDTHLSDFTGRWSFGLLSGKNEVMVVGGFAGWKLRYNDVWLGTL